MVVERYDRFTDQQLALLLRAGNVDVFKLIYNRFWDKMLVVAAKRLDHVAEAEEVVQDIFLNLWRKRETFVLKVSFENYLAVALKFEIINRRAKRAREHDFRTQLASQLPVVHVDRINFDLDYLQQQLEHSLNSLPPKCRLVFRLSRDNEYTNKQIAKELEISEKAVEKHISKALKVLRERFGRQ